MTLANERPVSPAEIRAHRRSIGLKQAALADLLDVDQATISRWERGRLPIEKSAWSKLRRLGDHHAWRRPWPSQLTEAKTDGHWPALLKQYRLFRSLSQEQLADILGYTTESISRWESGRFTPSLAAQLKLRDLILSPLDSDSHLERLFQRVNTGQGHISMQWGIFAVACSPALKRVHARHRYDIGMLSNVEELHDGKYNSWVGQLRETGFLRSDAPLSQAWFKLAEGDTRSITAYSVPLANGDSVWVAIHRPWKMPEEHRDGEFSILHADELIA